MINFKTTLLFIYVLFSFHLAFAKQKVMILYSTGGHTTAAKSIETMLQQYPEEFEVIRHDFAEDLKGFAHWFYFGGYDLISRRASWINKLGVKFKWLQAEKKALYASQRFNSEFNQPENILKYIEKEKPDIIITTHFSLAETLALLREDGHLKNTPIAWTHLDAVSNIFFKQIGDQLDMSFVPTDEMAEEWKRILGENKVISSGIPIMPEMLMERDATARAPILSELGLHPETKTVLLMGGSMGALSYEKIIQATVREFGSTPIQFIAVCGRNETVRKSLETWAQDRSFPSQVQLKTTGFINSEQIKRLQIAADLIVSKPGGLTTFELLTSNRPVIMTEEIGLQEFHNAKFVDDNGAAIFVPKTKNIGPLAVELLTNAEKQNKLVAGQKRLRGNFHLEKIIDWTRNAKVTQLMPLQKTVLQRLREEKGIEIPLSHPGRCERIFTF